MVKYCNEEERCDYIIHIDESGLMSAKCKNEALTSTLPEEALTSGHTSAHLEETQRDEKFAYAPLTTGADGWIFVIQNDILYAAPKVTNTSPR